MFSKESNKKKKGFLKDNELLLYFKKIILSLVQYYLGNLWYVLYLSLHGERA